MRGVIIISVPKSGTMFLFRYLAKLTGFNSKFGLFPADLTELLRGMPQEPDPMISSCLSPSSPGRELMARRYLQMMNPHGGPGRPAISRSEEKDCESRWIIADHGFDNFLTFLRNPDDVRILRPTEIVEEAKKRDMGVIYLFRDLKAIVNSLAHFISSGRAFLLRIRSLEEALEVAIQKYSKVLADHTQIWEREFNDGILLSYERLHHDLKGVITDICQTYGLPYKHEDLISEMKEFQTWTYRRGDPEEWRSKLTEEQKSRIERR
jgi:hypothetical protein